MWFVWQQWWLMTKHSWVQLVAIFVGNVVTSALVILTVYVIVVSSLQLSQLTSSFVVIAELPRSVPQHVHTELVQHLRSSNYVAAVTYRDSLATWAQFIESISGNEALSQSQLETLALVELPATLTMSLPHDVCSWEGLEALKQIVRTHYRGHQARVVRWHQTPGIMEERTLHAERHRWLWVGGLGLSGFIVLLWTFRVPAIVRLALPWLQSFTRAGGSAFHRTVPWLIWFALPALLSTCALVAATLFWAQSIPSAYLSLPPWFVGTFRAQIVLAIAGVSAVIWLLQSCVVWRATR
jgi:hypothetical protein